MIFRETGLKGAFIVDLERKEDERGFFARAWCRREFEKAGLATEMVQGNIAFNRKKGTLRGMHYQAPPNEEDKLVRCTRGSIYDAIIDLRPDSPTCGKWVAVELTEDNRRMIYVPRGFAHGYLTLEDETEVVYQVSAFYSPESERGVRWDDPAFGVDWPRSGELIISEKDSNWPDFVPRGKGGARGKAGF